MSLAVLQDAEEPERCGAQTRPLQRVGNHTHTCAAIEHLGENHLCECGYRWAIRVPWLGFDAS